MWVFVHEVLFNKKEETWNVARAINRELNWNCVEAIVLIDKK